MAATERITMTMRELDRFKVIQDLVDGRLTPWRAAERLGLSVRRLKILFTNNLGVFIGRAVPVVGEALLTYDAATITYRSVIRYNQLAKPEDKVF